ncbi:MAG TPA: endonuclease domain-containing protein [Candidatus Ruania gallistercoris]|uniref:Endonuclease domain-containing protein n=1 Tax=Candidatus Ruania gallistercoris TaxID=2838746 RepID=A0A9D2EI83_9MICO|nr:endonuclease domain-containing protein [Candidatus Ruania gallistercoris]
MVTQTAPTSRRAWRRTRARELAAPFGGVVHRRDLRAAGIGRDEVRSELRGERWVALGRHTIGIDTALVPEAWPAKAAWAVWETGSGAVLDGVSAMLAAGLENFTEEQIVVSVPRGTRAVRLPGVRVHSHRVIHAAPVPGLPRMPVEVAVVNATGWAVSDRQAALIVILAVQQRLTTATRLTEEMNGRRRVRRRQLLREVFREVAGGVQALGELDFARLCRQYDVPEPTRQRLCRGPRGRIYLDVWWEEFRVGVEIDGVQHRQGLAPVEDALRDNEVRLRGGPVLRIPSLGLLTDPGGFMRQVRELVAHRKVT